MQHKIGSKRIWTISGFHIPSEFFSQLSLIFVIRIPCDADQLDAVRISESSIEITAVFFDLLLTGGRFFYGKFAAGHLADLFSVQPGRQDPLASALLHLLTSDEIADAAALSSIRVTLTAESGELMRMSFAAENSGDLHVNADAVFTDASAPVVPDEVLSAIRSSGGAASSSTLTDDALRLLHAWGELTNDISSSDISLSADCGPIVLSSTLQYDRSSIDGQSYGCIRKSTLAVYFSGDKICDASGNSVDAASAQFVDASSLIDLCYSLILDGSAGCERVSDGYLYGLSLDSDAMNDLAAAIAPDIKAQNVTFSSGRISVLVSEQGALKSVNISCSGALHLILSDAPASLSAVITPAEREFSIPQPALNALKQ